MWSAGRLLLLLLMPTPPLPPAPDLEDTADIGACIMPLPPPSPPLALRRGWFPCQDCGLARTRVATGVSNPWEGGSSERRRLWL